MNLKHYAFAALYKAVYKVEKNNSKDKRIQATVMYTAILLFYHVLVIIYIIRSYATSYTFYPANGSTENSFHTKSLHLLTYNGKCTHTKAENCALLNRLFLARFNKIFTSLCAPPVEE